MISKTFSALQNNANVIVLSPSAMHSPYIKLITLFKSFANGGCDHISIDSIQKSISAHSIVLLLKGVVNKFVHSTYRRDLLSIVQANCQPDGCLHFLHYNSISKASLGYLLNLPLECTLRSRAPSVYMLWKNYAALELFISLPKQTHFTFITKEGAPDHQDLLQFQQLLLEPLWMNGLFVDPISHNPLIPFSKGMDILNFKHIWSIQQRSIQIPRHNDQCSPACSRDQHCRNFWNACIPLTTIEFAAWCSHLPIPVFSTNNEIPAELVSFSLDIAYPVDNHALTPLNDCTG